MPEPATPGSVTAARALQAQLVALEAELADAKGAAAKAQVDRDMVASELDNLRQMYDDAIRELEQVSAVLV